MFQLKDYAYQLGAAIKEITLIYFYSINLSPASEFCECFTDHTYVHFESVV